MTYTPYTTETVLKYARTFTDVFPTNSVLRCEEIGDGNLNYVFRVEDQFGHRLIFKQALPYAKVVGESWPLSLDRSRIESDALRKQAEATPLLVPKVFAYQEEKATTVMEDLYDYEVLRGALLHGYRNTRIYSKLGEFIAENVFHTSDLKVLPEHKKLDAARFINPDLCRITELLVFTDPYYDAPTNNVPDDLQDEVHELWNDQEARSAIAELKYAFVTRSEALVHGDLHTGSIMVWGSDVKVIDPEFAYYGPISFDVGLLIGNLYLNLASNLASRTTETDDLYWRTAVEDVWSSFEQTFSRLWTEFGRDDHAFRSPSFRGQFLRRLWHEALGFAGAELIRRTIGLAHVEDLDSIKDEKSRLVARQFALRLGRDLLVHRGDILNLCQLRDVVRSHIGTSLSRGSVA